MKKLVLLLAVAALLLTAACGGDGNGYENGADASAAENGAQENSPASAVSDFFRYLAGGSVASADAILLHSDGSFAEMSQDMYSEIGAYIFSNISYSNLAYIINGDGATATFTMRNVNFFEASFQAGIIIGEAGLVDIADPDFEALIADLSMPIVGEMINEGTAPMFETDVQIDLRLVDGAWRIVDNDAGFAMSLLGMPGI